MLLAAVGDAAELDADGGASVGAGAGASAAFVW